LCLCLWFLLQLHWKCVYYSQFVSRGCLLSRAIQDPYPLLCPVGTHSSSQDMPKTSARNLLFECRQGDYRPTGTCPIETFGTSQGLTSADQCSICPAGSYCPSGSFASSLCLPGTYEPSTGAGSSCQSCAPGYACPHAGMTSMTLHVPQATHISSTIVLLALSLIPQVW
jgi:hypothetical protein